MQSNAFAQDEYKKTGCKYVSSKFKVTGFTKEQLQYADELKFRSDTFDIINYNISLDVTDFSTRVLHGNCAIDFVPKMQGLDYIVFDLLQMSVDSVFYGQDKIAYNYESPFLKINFDTLLTQGDTFEVKVYYHGVSVIDPSGFGGFYFDKGYAYNLGIGLASIPHNYGRSWFPCFDNFVERSTYDFNIITKSSHFAYCSGDFEGVDTLSNGKKVFHYRMRKQIPTYLAGVAASDYKEVNWTYEGLEKEIPIKISAKPQDISNVPGSFAYLPGAIEALEYWYGPYRWNRIGYALTSHGAMEHATNIAFNDFLGNDGNPNVAMGIMTHELAHHWWGNVTTLTTAYDMWIKEGNSEYGWHLFVEHFFGKDRFIRTIKDNQFDVITNAHIDDKGYFALSGMPMDHTYGTTTYNKGAAVMHNLRTYMGDSLYRVGLQSILDKYAFSHLDAAQFEEQLELSTGLDLSCFFDDWIYAPGFSSFEIDSVNVYSQDAGYRAEVFLEQKLFHAPHYHCEVPLEISFYDENMNREVRKVVASGQFTKVDVYDLPFRPNMYFVNENQKLNNGKLGENFYIKSNERYISHIAKVSISTPDLPKDSLFLRVEHTWGPADEAKNNELAVSKNHYWTFYGLLPDYNEMKATFYYNSHDANQLDYDLIDKTDEDSIVVLYRPNSSYDWYPVENQKKIKGSPKDGRGKITITGVMAGQYTFGKLFNPVKNKNLSVTDIVDLSPVPAADYVYINTSDMQEKIKNIEVFNSTGQRVLSYENVESELYRLDLTGIKSGLYFVKIRNKAGSDILKKMLVLKY